MWLAFIGGRKCTARLSKREPPAIDWELRLMEFARTRAVGAPKVVPTASGELHRDRVFVVEWVDGDLPGSERDWRDVAGALERLRSVFAEPAVV